MTKKIDIAAINYTTVVFALLQSAEADIEAGFLQTANRTLDQADLFIPHMPEEFQETFKSGVERARAELNPKLSKILEEEERDMEVIKIKHSRHGDTTVKVVRETAKAILLAGNASEAWFPKAAINSDNWVADWFSLSLEHFFLFDAPYKEEAA